MKAASFFPGKHYSSLYAMAGDDCSLFFDLENLTEKQRADHHSNVELTAMLQVALICIGHDKDHLALYEEYQEPRWQDTLHRYQDFFKQMAPETIPAKNLSYHPKDKFYQSVAKMIENNPFLTDVANLYMSSSSNKVIHQDPKLLSISRDVNSKKHFAEHAPAYGIPVPETLVITKKNLRSKKVDQFFKEHNNKIMLKLLGLAGSRNVLAVKNIFEVEDYVAQYKSDMVILLQERLDLNEYTEMTVDLMISDKEIRIANTRKILFADGLWVGNLIGDSVSLTEEQNQILLKVGEYARHYGYVSREGSNCGIDFFIGTNGNIIVTEINARWTGGLFPAEILSQIDTRGRDAVPFFDMVRITEKESYIDFIDRYLVGKYEGDFAMAPIGFGCFPVPLEGQVYFYSWQMVIGDFESFRKVKQRELADGVMITADIIQPYQ